MHLPNKLRLGRNFEPAKPPATRDDDNAGTTTTTEPELVFLGRRRAQRPKPQRQCCSARAMPQLVSEFSPDAPTTKITDLYLAAIQRCRDADHNAHVGAAKHRKMRGARACSAPDPRADTRSHTRLSARTRGITPTPPHAPGLQSHRALCVSPTPRRFAARFTSASWETGQNRTGYSAGKSRRSEHYQPVADCRPQPTCGARAVHESTTSLLESKAKLGGKRAANGAATR